MTSRESSCCKGEKRLWMLFMSVLKPSLSKLAFFMLLMTFGSFLSFSVKCAIHSLQGFRCLFPLSQGSPTSGLQTSTGPQPVRNRAAQQQVSGGQASKASSAAPHCSPSLALPPEPFPTPESVKKLSSTKPVPGAKKVGDHCFIWHISGKNKERYIHITVMVSFSFWRSNDSVIEMFSEHLKSSCEF